MFAPIRFFHGRKNLWRVIPPEKLLAMLLGLFLRTHSNKPTRINFRIRPVDISSTWKQTVFGHTKFPLF